MIPSEAAPPPDVADLMEALRQSVGREQASKHAKKPKAASGQKEMLLPIAGKKPAKEAAKETAKETAKGAARRKAG
jgi:DNA end-binding protein Ku